MVQQRFHRNLGIALALDRANQARQDLVADGAGNHFGKGWQGHVPFRLRQGWCQTRLELGQDDHIANIQRGQHDAGKEGTGIKLHHRHAGGSTVNNQQDRGRNQNAQATASGDGTGRELDVVTRFEHGRECQQPHQRHHRTHDAGGRGKNGAGDDGGHCQRTRYPRSRQMQTFEEFLDQVGPLHQVTHEDEQGNRNQHVVGHHRIGALHHQVQRLLHRQRRALTSIGNPGEHHAHPHQGKGGRKAKHDGNHDEGQHQQSQMTIGHLRGRGQQNKSGQHHGGHDGEAKPDFFSHGWLPLGWIT